MMVCNACQFKACAFHKLPWHEGMTCAEFDALESQVDRLMEEEATAKLLAKTSKICPSCKQCITKESGCDHLECEFTIPAPSPGSLRSDHLTNG
jgi:hypothetical protein